MAMTKRGWTFVFVGVFLAIAGILLYAYRDKIFGGGDVDKPTEPVPPGSTTPDWVPERFPLNVGMYGPKIKAMQKALGIEDDGQFGDRETKPALLDAGYRLPLSEADYNAIVKPGVGQDAYAIRNGVKVYNRDGSLFATKNDGDWVGRVTGRKGAYTDKWIQAYIVSGDKFVDENDVYLS